MRAPNSRESSDKLGTNLIPDNAARPGDDPIFALHGEATKRAAQGESILNATLGALMEDDGRPALMPAVAEAFGRIPPERYSLYAPISGPPQFLSAVMDDLVGASHPLRELMTGVSTAGGTGAVHHGLVNYVEPGQALLTTSYYWGPYGILANHTKRRLATFQMFADDGRLNVEAMERAAFELLETQGRLFIVLNTPCHNPTGYSMDADDWEDVVDLVARCSAKGPTTLLLDQAYFRFAPPGALDWVGYVERLVGKATVLFAWSGSKAFAQYGSRIGALVALHEDPQERARISNALGYSCRGTWSNCNHLGMLAITECLTDPDLRARTDSERERLVKLLGTRVERFNELAQAAGLVYPRYEGGFFVTVFTADADKTAALMRDQGVFVVPLKGAVRVGLCAAPTDSIPRLVEALAQGVQAAGGVTANS